MTEHITDALLAEEAQARPDCRHFSGERPCRFSPTCAGCPHYDRPDSRVLIIKVGALGDVLRTTTVLPAFRERWPRAHLTWLTAPAALPLLRRNPKIDRVLAVGPEALDRLRVERFDLLVCLDKEPGPTSWAMQIEADERRGFGRSRRGRLIPLSRSSIYAYRMGFDDELKFRRNRLTHPELLHEMLDLPYSRRGYDYAPDDASHAWARRRVRAAAQRTGIDLDGRPLVGLVPGAGPRYHAKCWPVPHYAELARRLWHAGIASVALGGPDDRPKLRRLLALDRAGILDVGCDQSIDQAAALVACCDVLVVSDTLLMHLAIAVGVPPVVIMGPTCVQEIDLFDKGRILATDYPCAPCYLASCDPARRPPGRERCLAAIRPARVFEAVVEELERGRPETQA